MTEHDSFPEYITTYQRVLISDWPAIAKLIYKHTCLLKEGGYNEESFESDPRNVLSERQIKDALQGPYSACFLANLRSFARLARLKMALHIDKEDSLKDNLSSCDEALAIDPKQLEKFSIDEALKLQEQFDEQVTYHCQQWEGQLFFWQMSLITAIRESGANITEMEADDFSAPEPVSELLARYNDLNVSPPKVRYPLSFADYFRLKAYLIIHSALGRMHLPHEAKDIEKHMKHLKNTLHEIEKKEKDITEIQHDETEELLKPIAFIKLKK